MTLHDCEYKSNPFIMYILTFFFREKKVQEEHAKNGMTEEVFEIPEFMSQWTESQRAGKIGNKYLLQSELLHVL